jgi:hypothetical protein
MCLYNLCYWRQILRKFGIYKKISVKQNSINMVRLPCIYQNQNIWKATDAPQHLWCILFTIYDVFYSQYMIYLIHNIWYISFTVYDIFYSQYMLYFIHNILCILFTIWYFFHNIVNKIRHKFCSAFVASLYVLNHSISSCNNLFSCSPAVRLHTKTDRLEKPHRCSFSDFLFDFTVRWASGLPDQIVGCLWTLNPFCPPKQLTLCTPYSALTSTLHASG